MQSLFENSGIRDAVLRLDIEQYHCLCRSGIIPVSGETLSCLVFDTNHKSESLPG